MEIIKEPITLQETNEVLNKASEAGAFIEGWEGVLNDMYVISGMAGVQIDDEEPTEHIILLAEYATSWSNDLYMIRTNDDKVAEHYTVLFENQYGYDEEEE